jgi:two-component system chemotaxis response regulator CheB
MICDDSAVIRRAIGNILEADPGIQVVARVANGRAAVDSIASQLIDVLVLDIEMPVMDGLTALPLLLKASPGVSIIMASTLTTRGADVALQAIRLGAADTIAKPSAAEIQDGRFAAELLARVRGLARLRRNARAAAGARRGAGTHAVPGLFAPGPSQALTLMPAPRQAPMLLAIGSSTGGPNALFALVKSLNPPIRIPIVLTQHMPATFTTILAEHIDRLGVKRRPQGLFAELSDEPAENFCRPSVDPMLRSASAAVDGRVLVIMLTGMGSDGLAGTRAVVEAGGAALAQDEASSVVWGMPGAIARAGLAHAVLPLEQIGARAMQLIQTQGSNR